MVTIIAPGGLASIGAGSSSQDLVLAQLDIIAAASGGAVHAAGGAVDPLVFRLSIFVLAVFVGYYVVWSVTPALHTPLMCARAQLLASALVYSTISSSASSRRGRDGLVGLRRSHGYLLAQHRILLRQLLHAPNPQQLKIPQHRRPDRNQILQLPLFFLHNLPLDTRIQFPYL